MPDKRDPRDTVPVVLIAWAYAQVGELLIVCSQGERAADDAEFARWMWHMERAVFSKLLIQTVGAEPTPAQRAQIAAFWRVRGSAPPVAVMTNSRVGRAVITAMDWFVKTETHAFAEHDLDGALAWLQLSKLKLRVESKLVTMRDALHRKRSHAHNPKVPSDLPPRA